MICAGLHIPSKYSISETYCQVKSDSVRSFGERRVVASFNPNVSLAYFFMNQDVNESSGSIPPTSMPNS